MPGRRSRRCRRFRFRPSPRAAAPRIEAIRNRYSTTRSRSERRAKFHRLQTLCSNLRVFLSPRESTQVTVRPRAVGSCGGGAGERLSAGCFERRDGMARFLAETVGHLFADFARSGCLAQCRPLRRWRTLCPTPPIKCDSMPVRPPAASERLSRIRTLPTGLLVVTVAMQDHPGRRRGWAPGNDLRVRAAVIP
jgi:hypothetical protein